MIKTETEQDRPFFQGKVDNFCAGYAVLNAIKLLRKMSALQGRVVLNEMLFYEAKDPESWIKVLNHETDYNALVSRMLKVWEEPYRYNYFRPFDPANYGFNPEDYAKEELRQNLNMAKPEISLDEIWNVFTKYTKLGESVVLFRFCRFLPQTAGPIVDHWTTLAKIDKNTLYFYDCSLEKSGWYVVPKHKVYVAPFYSIAAQNLSLRNNFKLNLSNEEFAVLCPEHIHILEARKGY